MQFLVNIGKRFENSIELPQAKNRATASKKWFENMASLNLVFLIQIEFSSLNFNTGNPWGVAAEKP